MLDGQVVRAALKSYNLLAVTSDHLLGLHSNYLRLLSGGPSSRPVITTRMWHDHAAIIHLLEWRAALAVQTAARNLNHPDAGIHRRLSKAITEAFVAAQVGNMVSDLNQLSQKEASALGDLYLLVRFRTALVELATPLTAPPYTLCISVFTGHDGRGLGRSLYIRLVGASWF